MDQEKVGKIIKERRKEKGLTQVKLAEKLRVSNRTISKWENGNSLPDYSMINDICKILDLSPNELLQGKKEINKKKKTIIILLICLIIFLILYKAFITYFYYRDVRYKFEDTGEYEDIIFPDKNVSSIETNNNKLANTIVYDEINLYIPDDFKLITDKSKSNLVSDICTPYIKGLKGDKSFGSAIIVCKDGYNLYNQFYNEYNIKNTIIPYMNMESLFEKYDIHNIVDLIKFYEKNKNFKQNIFTSSNDIKINYLARTYTRNTLTNYDYFYYLEGELNGYMVTRKLDKGSSFRDMTLSFESDHREKIYNISLINYKEKYFNNQLTKKILNSVYKK